MFFDMSCGAVPILDQFVSVRLHRYGLGEDHIHLLVSSPCRRRPCYFYLLSHGVWSVTSYRRSFFILTVFAPANGAVV